MDKVVKVRHSFLSELRGFCNRFVGICDGCFRHPCDCGWADTISLAKNLIFRIDNIRDAEEETLYRNDPRLEMFETVIKALEQAGHPLTAGQIKVCEGTGKYWRQKRNNLFALMIRRGMLVRFVRNGNNFYALPEWEANENQTQKQDNTKKDKDHGIQP